MLICTHYEHVLALPTVSMAYYMPRILVFGHIEYTEHTQTRRVFCLLRACVCTRDVITKHADRENT